MGNSDSQNFRLIESNRNDAANYEYINSLEKKVQSNYEGYKKFKNYFNIFVSVTILMHIIIIICEYFYGGFILKDSPTENPLLNAQYFNMTFNLNNYQSISLGYDSKSMYCFGINSCSYLPLDGVIIEEEITSSPTVDFSKICKTQIKINFNTKQMEKDKKHFVTCENGYIYEGFECPSINSFLLDNTNLNKSDYMINLCIENGRLQARHRIPIHQSCLGEMKKDINLYTMNEYTGTYFVYTIIQVSTVILEIFLIIHLNMKFKQVKTGSDKFESIKTVKYTENIRQNGNFQQIEREANIAKSYEKDYYVTKKQTFDDKLFTMRVITFCIFLFLILLAFSISQQKVSSYNDTFKFIFNLYSNNCFLNQVYRDIFKQIYEANIGNFTFFFYYRYAVNYANLACLAVVCVVDIKFFTFKEFFTICDSKKVTTSQAEEAAKGFEY